MHCVISSVQALLDELDFTKITLKKDGTEKKRALRLLCMYVAPVVAHITCRSKGVLLRYHQCSKTVYCPLTFLFVPNHTQKQSLHSSLINLRS